MKQKRPKWVWAITIFYVLSLLWTLLSFYLVLNGKIPLSPEQKLYFDNLGPIDWGITVIHCILSFSAAITLFMLNKITVKIWLACILFSVFSYSYALLNTSWAEVVGNGGGLGAFLGSGLLVVIYFYARKLEKRGILS